MSVYIISYDLRKPDFDYEDLYTQLDNLGAKRIQKSVWGVDTVATAAEVFNSLWNKMHSEKDRLFVIPFDKTDEFKSQNAITKLKSF